MLNKSKDSELSNDHIISKGNTKDNKNIFPHNVHMVHFLEIQFKLQHLYCLDFQGLV